MRAMLGGRNAGDRGTTMSGRRHLAKPVSLLMNRLGWLDRGQVVVVVVVVVEGLLDELHCA